MSNSAAGLLRVILAVPSALFWGLWLLRPAISDNHWIDLVWIGLGVLSFFTAGACAVFAIKAKRDVAWWLLFLFSISAAIGLVLVFAFCC